MSKKLYIISAILVFLIGLIGGAYLVLKSTVTHGELADSTPASRGKSSDELLDELLKLNQNEETRPPTDNLLPEEKNITDEYIKKIVDSGGLSQEHLEEIESTDFLSSVVLPYLASNKPQIFPIIPDSSLKIVPDSKTNFQKYFKDSNAGVVTFFKSMQKMTGIDAEKITETKSVNDFTTEADSLGTAFQNLSRINVPKKHVELHKNILISIYSLQKMYESILNSEEDPLKSLIIFNDIESVGEFWKNTLIDYENGVNGKK